MGNISSVNFKKIIDIKQSDKQLKHNTIDRPDYKIKEENQKYNMDFESASKYRDEIIETARLNYEKKYKQKFQAKSYLWHCVINIKEDSTMDDVKAFVDYLESEFGFKVFQYAIHTDEGHIENGKEIINHHAHIELCSLDVETGINLWKKSKPKENDIHKKAMSTNTMREIQTKTAEILGMERGKDKRETGAKRIEPRKWAMIKEQEKKEIQMLKKENEKKLKSKDKQWLRKFVYSTFEDTRKSMIEENKNAKLLCNDNDDESMILYDKDDYKALRDEKAKIETMIENCENPEDIEIQTDIMLLAMKKIEEVREKARERAKDKGRILKQDMEYYKDLSNIPAPIGEITPNNEPSNENKSDDVEKQINDLKDKNKQLKADLETINNKFDAYIKNVNVILEYIFEKFKISNIVELAFNWKKSQELNQEPQTQEPKVESKFDNYQFRYPQPKKKDNTNTKGYKR